MQKLLPAPARATLTEVDLFWIDGEVEHWIRFGHSVGEAIVNRHHRVVRFAPGYIFALIRWRANAHGTVFSRIDIVRAIRPGGAYTTTPYVRPGGESLLRLTNWSNVAKALAAIRDAETAGVAAEDVCPDHWRHVMACLSAGEKPRAYTMMRHRAWLLRRSLES